MSTTSSKSGTSRARLGHPARDRALRAGQLLASAVDRLRLRLRLFRGGAVAVAVGGRERLDVGLHDLAPTPGRRHRGEVDTQLGGHAPGHRCGENARRALLGPRAPVWEQPRDRRAEHNRRAFGGEDLQRPARLGLVLHRRLVSLDLDDRVPRRHAVAGLLEPAHDRPLLHGVRQAGHPHVGDLGHAHDGAYSEAGVSGAGNGAASAAVTTAAMRSAIRASAPSSSAVVHARRRQPLARHHQRVALAHLVQLARLAVGAGVAARVPDEPVGERLQERRPGARARVLHRALRRLAHRPHVHAVDGLRPQPQRLGAGPDLPGGHVLDRRELHVAVVLAHEHGRELEHAREVQALGEVGLIGRALAEEGDRDVAGAPPLEGEGRAGGGGDRSADDAEAPDQPMREVDHVHGARAARAHARLAAEQLGHQRLGVDPEGQRVPVPAVRPGHAIGVRQNAAHADRPRLLAGVQVRRAVHFALLKQGLDRVLEAADERHALIQLQPQVDIDGVIALGCGGVSHVRRAPLRKGSRPRP